MCTYVYFPRYGLLNARPDPPPLAPVHDLVLAHTRPLADDVRPQRLRFPWLVAYEVGSFFLVLFRYSLSGSTTFTTTS
jgi:hypothetical protein